MKHFDVFLIQLHRFKLFSHHLLMNQQRRNIQKQRLAIYISKLTDEDQSYQQIIDSLQVDFIKQAEQLIKEKFNTLALHFQKQKKSLNQQLHTLRYFDQHPEEKGNLFALFNQIDEKIYFNQSIIKSTHFTIALPHPSPQSLLQDANINKSRVQESYVGQLLTIIRSDNIRKYCKKQVESGQKTAITYEKMLSTAKQSHFCTQVIIKKSFQESLSQLSKYKHVQKLTLGITTANGYFLPYYSIKTTQQYHQIINSLLPNHLFLSKLQLKITDMQFSQQKCDILRRRLSSQLPRLKQLSIVNYYKQCKLGMFEDFNWHPYRKKVNVASGVW